MAWVSLGPLMVYIAREMNIPVEQKLTLVAIPVLSGAILRIPLGILADTIGSKITGVIAQIVMTVACLYVWKFGLGNPNQVAIFGALLGLGGASFSVALPQASRWYPPQLQGLVMGIAGAGNMGVVLDTLFAPSIAEVFGWQGVYAALLIPMIVILGIYIFTVKDAPGSVKPIALASYGKLLRDADSRWFMFFYFITFGGFVGLASALPLYFTTQFHVTPVAAGLMVSLIVFFGSTFRPVGGAIADRIGAATSSRTMCCC
jgi:NNP family nitrate/nitrite transporter-like MFS transporter